MFSFKVPSAEDLDHDFMWRYVKYLPERGRIGIFNRSYYEEVLVVRVHPEVLQAAEAATAARRQANMGRATCRHRALRGVSRPAGHDHPQVLSARVARGAEEALHGAAGQAGEALEVLCSPTSASEASGTDYMHAYEEAIRATATPHAPWFVVPADNKWFTRLIVAAAIVEAVEKLDLGYPKIDAQRRRSWWRRGRRLPARSR